MDFLNFSNKVNLKDLKELLYFIQKFDSYKKFCEFMKIIKSLPTINEVDKLAESNNNLYFFEVLQSNDYFKLFDPIQKYHLFATACSYNSVDIAILLLNNDIDLEGVKELMLNYLSYIGENVEYVIFRKIWEKNVIQLNTEEITICFFNILKSSNLEFIEWFCSLNLINIKNDDIKERIGYEIFAKANNSQDFIIAKYICSLYLEK
jgi:hypothetical protein